MRLNRITVKLSDNIIYKANVPLTDATMEIRIDAILSYLWFEEMLGGDGDIKMDQILKLTAGLITSSF